MAKREEKNTVKKLFGGKVFDNLPKDQERLDKAKADENGRSNSKTKP